MIERAANPEERVAAMEKWLLLKGMKKERAKNRVYQRLFQVFPLSQVQEASRE